jgi:drug/metabolite transporter (DMT)-like permease
MSTLFLTRPRSARGFRNRLAARHLAMNSVSTDPLIAVYPVFVMIGGHVFMKERLGIVAGCVMVVAGKVF